MKNNKIITITGATGFIGKSLFPYIKENYNVFTLSLRDEKWRIEYNPNTEIIINLIGKAHDHKGLFSKSDFYEANYKVVKDLIEKFVESEAKLFIHLSSIAVLNNDNRKDWYSKSKLKADKWLLEQPLPNDKKIVILRPPMVHGQGDKGNLRKLYNFISKGFPYPLMAFENKRTLISIDNFCFFIEQIINNYENMDSGIYYIADDEPISTKEIVEVIQIQANKMSFNFRVPKVLINSIAKIGDFIPLPLNSNKLNKMTSDLIISNMEIKKILGIKKLPYTALEGVKKTINSIQQENNKAI